MLSLRWLLAFLLSLALSGQARADFFGRAMMRESAQLKRRPIQSSVAFESPQTKTPDKRLLRFTDDSQALFKPPAPRPVINIPAGTDIFRERGFYITACHLGLSNVPATTLRRVKGQRGSLQAWAKGRAAVDALLEVDRSQNLFVPAKVLSRLDWDSVHAVAVLDYVTNNRDRHWGNLLVQEEAGRLRLVAIDNGLSFATRESYYLWKASYELVILGAQRGGPTQLSNALWEKIRTTDEAKLSRHLLHSGLSQTEVQEAMTRLAHVKRDGLRALVLHRVPGLPDYLVDAGLAALSGVSAGAASSPARVETRFTSFYVSSRANSR